MLMQRTETMAARLKMMVRWHRVTAPRRKQQKRRKRQRMMGTTGTRRMSWPSTSSASSQAVAAAMITRRLPQVGLVEKHQKHVDGIQLFGKLASCAACLLSDESMLPALHASA